MKEFEVGKAPWETGGAQEFEVGKAPWEAQEDPVIQEMHPAVSWKDRALIKNLATTPEVGLKHLQTKYPNLEVKLDPKSNLIMKGKNEKEWRVLDPDTGFFSKDFAQDAGDLAFDIGSGIVEGAGTAAAGAGAAVASGGVAAIPAAMGAGAALSAGGETLRQKLGQQLGLEQDMDTDQIKMAGAFGAVSPLLFGTGGDVAKAAAKYTSKSGKEITADQLEKMVKSQRGVFGRTYDHAKELAPIAAELTSGVKAKNYTTYLKQLDEMKDWSANPNKFTDYVNNVGKEVERAAKTNVQKAGSEMGAILNEFAPGMQVDLTDVYRGFNQQVADLKNSTFEADNALADALQKKLNEMFRNSKTKEIRTVFSYDDAKVLRDKFKELNRNFDSDTTGNPHKIAYMKFGDDGYAGVNKTIDDALDSVEGGAGEAFKAARQNYRDALTVEQLVDAELFKTVKKTGQKDYSKTLGTLKNLDNDSKIMLKKTLEKVDPKISEKADKAEAFMALNNPSWFPVNSRATSTSRTIAMGTIGAGIGQVSGEGGLGGVPGTLIGAGVGLLGLSPRAWRAYMSAGKRGEEMLKNAFRTAGKPIPKDLSKYFNRQMAVQSGKNMTRERKEEKK